jgi:hypothetical protein
MNIFCTLSYRGAVIFFTLRVGSSGRILEVLVTNGSLIDWLRNRGRFVPPATDPAGRRTNNPLGRIRVGPFAYKYGAVKNQRDVPHSRTRVDSPRTSAEFRMSWQNFIALLTALP